MALETLMEKLIAALEANTASRTGTAAATTTAKADAKAGAKGGTKSDAPAVDFEVVKKAAGEVKAKHGAPAAKKIIKDAGKADSLNAVKPENYAALLLACQQSVAGDDAEPEEDEEDL